LPGGIAYVVGAAVIGADEDEARAAVTGVFARHAAPPPVSLWHEEGPSARRAIIDVLGEIGAVGHICVHFRTGRKKLEPARGGALQAVVPEIVRDGASLLLIESRGDLDDRRDRSVILDALNALQRRASWPTSGATRARICCGSPMGSVARCASTSCNETTGRRTLCMWPAWSTTWSTSIRPRPA
jgi:hypothetical protein